MHYISLPIKPMESEEYMEETMDKEAEEDVANNVEEIGKGVATDVHQGTWHTTVGRMECVPTQVPTA